MFRQSLIYYSASWYLSDLPIVIFLFIANRKDSMDLNTLKLLWYYHPQLNGIVEKLCIQATQAKQELQSHVPWTNLGHTVTQQYNNYHIGRSLLSILLTNLLQCFFKIKNRLFEKLRDKMGNTQTHIWTNIQIRHASLCLILWQCTDSTNGCVCKLPSAV